MAGIALSGLMHGGVIEFPGRCPGLLGNCAVGALLELGDHVSGIVTVHGLYPWGLGFRVSGAGGHYRLDILRWGGIDSVSGGGGLRRPNRRQ